MKNFAFVILLALFTPMLLCNSQNPVKQENTTSRANGRIEAYYFHFTARCVTCKTVESSTREGLETLYPQQTRQGLITFQSVNLEEESGKSLAKRFGVAGQTLLLVKGNRKINITNEGFMYAVPKPDKFKAIIKEKVESLLSSK